MTENKSIFDQEQDFRKRLPGLRAKHCLNFDLRYAGILPPECKKCLGSGFSPEMRCENYSNPKETTNEKD